MDKYLEALRAAGVADSIVLTFVLFIVVAPVFWKLMKEAVSLRRTERKDKLEGVFEVLSNEGINSHPLRVELAFRELFNIRMTFFEISYFLNDKSPLSSITDYKYGRRYMSFGESMSHPVLSRSYCKLWWQEKFSVFFFMVSALMLIMSLLFTAAAMSSDVAGDVAIIGVVSVMASLMLAWFCLDSVRAINAAVRIVGGWSAISKRASSQSDEN